MICPLMSYAANQVACVKDQCALWDDREDCCAILSLPRRLSSSLMDIQDVASDIKNRM
jgi:hypothetical protein